MPLRTPVQTIIVARKGDNGKKQRVRVPLNKPFNFTQAEIDDFKIRAPGALIKAFTEVEDDETPATAPAAKEVISEDEEAEAAEAAKKTGGKAKKPADKLDDEDGGL